MGMLDQLGRRLERIIGTERCARCLMPASYAGIRFDSNGLCDYCTGKQYYGRTIDPSVREGIHQKEKLAAEFERDLDKHRAKGKHDCLVLLSGGKDSSYLAYLLSKEYELNILGYSFDNGFTSRVARQNIGQLVAELGIDHVSVAPNPGFLARVYRDLLLAVDRDTFARNGYFGTVCPICSDFLITGTALKEAARRGIRLVMSGHGPEQIRRHFFEIPPEKVGTSWIPESARANLSLEEQRSHFWVPSVDAKNGVLPRVLHPFHVIDCPAPKEVQKKVVELGLINNASPRATNCHVNWLLQYLDRKGGFDPLVTEISYRVRTGTADRTKNLVLVELSNFVVKSGLYRRCIRAREIGIVLRRLRLETGELLECTRSGEAPCDRRDDG